jgi:mono/diheme cytochrome c family protein
MKTPVVLFLVTMGFALFAVGQSTKEVKKVPVQSTRADSGPEMFKTYCAACHGMDGKGGGPAADALKTPPADLTALTQKSGGKFPTGRVVHIIEGVDEIHAHGSSDMPLWGPIFHSLSPGNDSLVKLRISNLTKYIESLQN